MENLPIKTLIVTLFCILITLIKGVSPACANEMTQLVDKAIHNAQISQTNAGRWSFTLESQSNDGTFIATFNPTKVKGERWILVSPAYSVLKKQQQRAYDELTQSDDADLDILFDNPSELIGQNPEVISNDGKVVEIQSSVSANMAKKDDIAKHLIAITSIRVKSPQFLSYKMYAPKPFKLNAMIKFKQFNVQMELREIVPGGPITIVYTKEDMVVKTMFKKQRQSKTSTYSNFIRVTQ